jgi:paraquat-inducible protein A
MFMHREPAETTIACNTCGLVQRMEGLRPGMAAECRRCGSILGDHKAESLGRTAALSLAALILYVPANIYPILRMDHYGAYSESTVWDGCVKLFQKGQWVVAAIVFLASILIPLFKLLGLFFLVTTARLESARRRKERTWIYRIIRVIGPWAMLDVFLLSVLVALVKLDELATVRPGPGLLAFTAVVVLTILASASFDPKLIWEEPDKPS